MKENKETKHFSCEDKEMVFWFPNLNAALIHCGECNESFLTACCEIENNAHG